MQLHKTAIMDRFIYLNTKCIPNKKNKRCFCMFSLPKTVLFLNTYPYAEYTLSVLSLFVNLYIFTINNTIEKWFPNNIFDLANLYHKEFLSTLQHTLCHTDQSRDYTQRCLYSVLNTVVYSLDHTSLQHILYVKKVQLET